MGMHQTSQSIMQCDRITPGRARLWMAVFFSAIMAKPQKPQALSPSTHRRPGKVVFGKVCVKCAKVKFNTVSAATAEQACKQHWSSVSELLCMQATDLAASTKGEAIVWQTS